MEDAPARRERVVLEVLYERGDSTASEIQEALNDGSSYSAVRSQLRAMEAKGLVRHQAIKGRYTYSPQRPKGMAAKEALDKLVQTFFDGRVDNVMVTLLSDTDRNLSESEIQRLRELLNGVKEFE